MNLHRRVFPFKVCVLAKGSFRTTECPVMSCRSGRADAHQGMDAITEELNADVKAWCTGDRDSEMWRRIIRNLGKLKDLCHQVLANC